MWSYFLFAVFLGVLLLYLPGSLALATMGFKGRSLLCYAPLVSIFLIEIIAVAFSLVGVASGWGSLFGAVTLVSLVICCVGLYIRRKLGVACKANDFSIKDKRNFIPLLYLLFGCAVGLYVFLFNLESPDVLFQDWDNAWHVGLIRTFLETGNYSTLDTTLFPSGGVSPIDSSPSFYPAAYHGIVAMICDAFSCSVPIVINAVNFVFASVVFPLCCYVLLETLFPRDNAVLLFGAVACVAFGAFPWNILVFGPLYPNLASFALAPAVVASFIRLTSLGLSNAQRGKYLLVFLLGGVTLALCQPNAIFTAAVILMPWCAYRIVQVCGEICCKRKWSKKASIVVQVFSAILFLLVFMGIWVFAYNAPMMDGVVDFNWSSFASPSQSVINALTLAFVDPQAQLLLAGLVVMGIVYAVFCRKYFWLVASYLFACMIYCAAACSDGFAKSLLAGFWYTDFNRLAVTIVLVALPLACAGFSLLCKVFSRLVGTLVPKQSRTRANFVITGMFVLVFLGVNFYPNHSIPGIVDVSTAFGSLSEDVSISYSATENYLDDRERAFLQSVAEVVPEGALILNQPNDGSVFAYGLEGLNIYYRTYGNEWSGSESVESETIRLRLDRLTQDDSVDNAVHTTGAEYVLMLDQGTSEESPHISSYLLTDWTGFDAVSDSTPGLEIVLSDGDMRLYRILD